MANHKTFIDELYYRDPVTNEAKPLNLDLVPTLTSDKQGIKLPSGDTASRPTLTMDDAGVTRLNSETGNTEQWDGTQWVDISGGNASPVATERDSAVGVDYATATYTIRTAAAGYGIAYQSSSGRLWKTNADGTSAIHYSDDLGVTWQTDGTLSFSGWYRMKYFPQVGATIVASQSSPRFQYNLNGATLWQNNNNFFNKDTSRVYVEHLNQFVGTNGGDCWVVAGDNLSGGSNVTPTRNLATANGGALAGEFAWDVFTTYSKTHQKVVYACSTASKILTSDDGVEYPLAGEYTTPERFQHFAELGSNMYALDNTLRSKVYKSDDLINWTHVSTLPYTFAHIKAVPELSILIAFGNGNVIHISDDGANWIAHTLPNSNNYVDIHWIEEHKMLVLVAEDGTNDSVLTSR